MLHVCNDVDVPCPHVCQLDVVHAHLKHKRWIPTRPTIWALLKAIADWRRHGPRKRTTKHGNTIATKSNNTRIPVACHDPALDALRMKQIRNSKAKVPSGSKMPACDTPARKGAQAPPLRRLPLARQAGRGSRHGAAHEPPLPGGRRQPAEGGRAPRRRPTMGREPGQSRSRQSYRA